MNKYYFFFLFLFAVVCCSRVEPEAITRQEITYRVFDSRESLNEAIDRGVEMNTKSADHSTSLSLFASLNECEVQTDPILSYECSRAGVTDYQTDQAVYDLLGYDELVPNENFARLLNPQGIICVRDTLYKISPRGTYYFPASAKTLFEQKYPEYEQMNGVIIADDTYLIDTNVYRFDTFKEEYPILTAEYILNDAGIDSNISVTPDRSWPSYSWSNYPTYSGSASDYLNNQVFTYTLPSNRRMRTKVFHYDYVVYDVRGVTLKCQKHGTFGWSEVTSNALLITMNNLVVQLPYGGENAPLSSAPLNSFATTEEYFGETVQELVIEGYELPDNQINNVVTGGRPTLRSIVLSDTGIDIINYRVVRFRVHEHIRIVFTGAWPFPGTNTDEVRKILFNHVAGRAAKPLGGQFWYQALDDNYNFGALRVGTAF